VGDEIGLPVHHLPIYGQNVRLHELSDLRAGIELRFFLALTAHALTSVGLIS
jgi:hypothetical protein